MFHYLESDDTHLNILVVQRLRGYLLNEQLSSEILLPKFVQALQTIFRNSQKFASVSLDEWAMLIAKNRGKVMLIFGAAFHKTLSFLLVLDISNDAQCDQLLMDILLVRLNMPMNTMNSLCRLIQSKKFRERHNAFHALLALLKNTQIVNERNKTKNLPTISNQLYTIITRVLFNEEFNNNQVRQCVTAAKTSWLLNDKHREKLNNI